MITSLFDLDRMVREASARLAGARRGLADRGDWEERPQNPLGGLRALLGREMLREIGEVPDTLLAPALSARIAKLTLARVLWDDEVRIARAWSEPSVRLDDDVRLPRAAKVMLPGADAELVSPKTLLAAVLVDSDDARRGRVAQSLARGVRERLRDAVRIHAERRARAASVLGVSLDTFELPAPAAAIEGAADALLLGTQGFAERFAPWDRGLSRAMAREALSGWPAHLNPRWVLSVFAGTELANVSELREVRLPAVLGATSFARGLAAFGEAFGELAASSTPPFVLTRPMVDLRPLRIGALFGGLAGEAVFARRVLGLGPGPARDHARTFARAAVSGCRLGAAAVRTRRSLLPPRDDLDDRFCDETARAWGEPLPAELSGVLPRITEATPARFTAGLLAALDRSRMIERFDEDWYRNPRAAEALRALAAEPEAPVTEERLRQGAVELSRALGQDAS